MSEQKAQRAGEAGVEAAVNAPPAPEAAVEAKAQPKSEAVSAARPPLRAVVVGCGGMGRNQAGLLASSSRFELAGVCDAYEAAVREVGEAYGVEAFTDFAAMLERVRPQTVSVCTPTSSHAALTIAAAEAGVRGVYCEKPMATNLADARRMVAVCRERGVVLVINHQRRLGADMVEAKRLIDAGAIGRVRVLRGQCQGDVLSDGTHALDSLLYLADDAAPSWVLGQVHRDTESLREKRERVDHGPVSVGTGAEGRHAGAALGYRYGHAVESGAIAVASLSNGVRLELCFGDMVEPGRMYQDYEAVGASGRLWRTGDAHRGPNLFLQDGVEADCAVPERGEAIPVPAALGQRPTWRRVTVETGVRKQAMHEAYERFAEAIHTGEPHPMRGEVALIGFELNMGIYESARLRRRVRFPLEQERFPLELMVEAGEL